MIDSRNINELHPVLQRAATELIKRMKASGYDVCITSTYRDNERQNCLYAQGRTRSGNIVTNARGGESIHNYRLAFDICKNIRGQEYSDNNFFAKAGRIGREMGLTWGGDWKGFVDKPHFEFTNGLTLKQLKQGMRVPDSVKLKWESDTYASGSTLDSVQVKNDENNYVIGKAIILFNGVETEIVRILKDGTNYIKLRDLEKFGITVDYDTSKKIPTVTFS